MMRLFPAFLLLFATSSSAFAQEDVPAPEIRLPAAASLRIDGEDMARALEPMTIKNREIAALELLEKGYFPDSLRNLKAVKVRANGRELTYWITPDYLSLGHDYNYVLLPLAWISVKKLANSWGFVLPTTKMVDQIFKQADRVIWPRALPPTREMVEMPYILHHNRWIMAQEALEPVPGMLFAGHKKDIVMSSQLLRRKDKIAIYGWQNIVAGENIQPLCLWHGKNYVDYSHGIRLVANKVLVDGKMMAIQEVFNDPELAPIISYEGTLAVDRIMQLDEEKPEELMTLSARRPPVIANDPPKTP